MNKLFLILTSLLFIGCELPPDPPPTAVMNSEKLIPEFSVGEKVLLINDNPAVVVHRIETRLDGKDVCQYGVNYFNLAMELKTSWLYEFELRKSQ